jgi:hypothetical protein
MGQESNELSEGDVVNVINRGIFVFEGGKMVPIRDLMTFYEKGLDKKKAKIIYPTKDQDIKIEDPFIRIPGLNNEFAPPPGSIAINFQSDVGGAPSHNMHTYGYFNPQSGWLSAVTRTWVTNIAGGGFRGQARVMFFDADGGLVTWSQGHSFGAGSLLDITGPSDRTDPWGEYIPGEINRVKSISVLHTWDPNDLETILRRGKKYAEIIAEGVRTVVSIGAMIFL